MMAGLMKRIGRACSRKPHKSIYYSLFHSHILYGIIVWSSAGKVKMKRLQTIQNRAIRNLYGYSRETSIRSMHIDLGLLPIIELAKKSQITHIHNIKNQYIHSNTILTLVENTHNTRNSHFIRQKRSNTTQMGKNAALFNSIRNYNLVSTLFKNQNQIEFKNNIKKYFMEMYKSV